MNRAVVFFQILIISFSFLVLTWFLREFDFSILYNLKLDIIGLIVSIRLLSIILYQFGTIFFFKSFNESIQFSSILLINLSSTVSNYGTPVKIGFPLQIYLMKKILNINYVKGGTIVLANLILMYLLMIILSIIASFNFVNDSFPTNKIYNIGIIFLVFIFLVIILLIKTRHYFFRFKIMNRIFKTLQDGSRYLQKMQLKWILYSTIIFLFSTFLGSLIQYSVIKHIESDLSISIFSLFVIQGLPFLLGSISMVPLGLGVKDASLAFLISSIGVSPSIAFTTAMINRIITLGFNIPLGLVAINYLSSKGIMKSES